MGDRLHCLLVVATTLVVATAPGCSGPSDPEPDPNDDQACPDDRTLCADQCVDLEADPLHCGRCYDSCPVADLQEAHRVCREGTCGIDCAGQQTYCSTEAAEAPGICVDTRTDTDHCGACHHQCEPRSNAEVSCREGSCVRECLDDYTDCGGLCVNLEFDLRHCGQCHNNCEPDQGCQDGQCVDEVQCDEDRRPFGGGRGTPVQPYLICAFEHLDNIDTDPEYADAHFSMRADLDFSDQPPEFRNDFVPLFKPDLTVSGFRGRLEGNGHTIRNLEFELPNTNEVGLFKAIHADGIIRDLTLVDPDVEGEFSVGTLAGELRGVVREVTIEGADVQAFSRVGGLAGFQGASGARIEQTRVTGEVTGASNVGGVVGRTGQGSISGVDSDVAVSATQQHVGGVAGSFAGNRIEDTHATGPVSILASAVVAGGLVGRTEGVYDAFDDNWPTTIRDSRADGDVVGDETVGGLVGHHQGLIDRTGTSGEVVGNDRVGGLVGRNDGEIRESRTDSTVDSASQSNIGEVGGLVGHNDGEIADAYALGDVDGSTRVGGLIGTNAETGSVRTCYSFGAPAGDDPVGGLVAVDNGQSSSAYFNVDTAGTTDSAAGQGLSNDEFADQSIFEDSPDHNWDFDDVWTLSATGDRPALQWED